MLSSRDASYSTKEKQNIYSEVIPDNKINHKCEGKLHTDILSLDYFKTTLRAKLYIGTETDSIRLIFR